MAFSAFRGMGAWSQLIMTAFIVLTTFLLVFVISILAAIPFIGLADMMAMFSGGGMNNPSAIALLKYFQIIQSIGLFVLPPLIIGWLFSGNPADYLQLDRKTNFNLILISIAAVLIVNPFISFVGQINNDMRLPAFLSDLEEWMRRMEDQAEALIDRFMDVKTVGGLLFNLFMIAVIPAVGEEFLFRGVVQKICTRMTHSHHWGIWISAFFFSALHMQFYGFVPRMLLGGLFGYMLVYSGSLWLPISSHFVNNALGVLILYFENQGYKGMEKLSAIREDTIYMLPAAVISLVATLYLMLLLKRKSSVLKGQVDL
ncbi:MAG: CPBP family intramembrane glutamic endopeptidase [Prolixibacteraceae bacterium]